MVLSHKKLWGHLQAQSDQPSTALTGVVTAVLTLLVHSFYIQRIFLLSKRNYWIATPILFLAVCRLAVACSTSAEMLRLKNFASMIIHYNWLLSLGLALSSTVDVIISAVIFTLLWLSRRDSLSLDGVIDSLILYTLEIGTLTGCTTVVAMIVWLTVPNKLIFLAIHFNISKLYANSLMAALNSRYKLRRANETSFLRLQDWRIGTPSLEFRGSAVPTQCVQINVAKSVNYDGKDGENTELGDSSIQERASS
jgi:hypothetical protein